MPARCVQEEEDAENEAEEFEVELCTVDEEDEHAEFDENIFDEEFKPQPPLPAHLLAAPPPLEAASPHPRARGQAGYDGDDGDAACDAGLGILASFSNIFGGSS